MNAYEGEARRARTRLSPRIDCDASPKHRAFTSTRIPDSRHGDVAISRGTRRTALEEALRRLGTDRPSVTTPRRAPHGRQRNPHLAMASITASAVSLQVRDAGTSRATHPRASRPSHPTSFARPVGTNRRPQPEHTADLVPPSDPKRRRRRSARALSPRAAPPSPVPPSGARASRRSLRPEPRTNISLVRAPHPSSGVFSTPDDRADRD